MNKFFLAILLLTFSFLEISFSKVAFAQNAVSETAPVSNVSSFELFWPIVAGKVSGDSLYPLKTFKEKVRGLFIFSNIKKSEYNLFLSEKRLVEFEKLILVNKDFVNAQKTLDKTKFYHSKTLEYLEKAKTEGVIVGPTTERVINSFNNQVLLLKDIAFKVDDNQKKPITEIIASLSTEVKKLE